MRICPYCNGLEVLTISCPACSSVMKDTGTLQEILGPYSPHEENSLIHAQYGCTHQVYCENCTDEYFYAIPESSAAESLTDESIEHGDND